MENVDVLIVGAGLSGIAAARGLMADNPSRSMAVFEGRGTLGGTWDLFRYPGVRSDSDMTTLSFRDRPWKDPRTIAPGPAILDYLRNTADADGVTPRIRFRHKVTRAEWSGASARWIVDYERGGSEGRDQISCSFLLMCTGYYRYDEGYRPEWPGLDSFEGALVHPQHWPESLDCAGRKFIVIGSGATAVSLIPALCDLGAHVTMVQRSPGYIVSLPAIDAASVRTRRLLPPRLAEWVNRTRRIVLGTAFYALTRRQPAVMRRLLRKGMKTRLPEGYDVDTHFSPSYDPWDQRLCLAPDGDFFEPIRSGRAEVVTDSIAAFTRRGIRLASGRELEADVVVTATGLNLLFLGGIELVVDGKAVDAGNSVSYRGMMLSGVPNLAFMIGYTNASWTLKVDLVVRHIVKLLRYMERHGHHVVVPRSTEQPGALRPLIDLSSGYVRRDGHLMPKKSGKEAWRTNQNYFADTLLFRRAVGGDGLEFAAQPGAGR